MSDSVDRVFSHALNTVNKIRTGSQKPPSAARLRLYGLYKQAMEGNVEGIMPRPQGSSEAEQRAREKWDAWNQQAGLSRTQAKRRYITALIETMRTFASPSPDSRELVAELEFVWNQVKSNVPSSSSSSPVLQGFSHDRPLRVVSPMSQSAQDLEEEQEQEQGEEEEEEEEEEADIERDEFVDAPDSQYNPTEEADIQHNPRDNLRRPPQHQHSAIPPTTPTPAPRLRSIIPQSISIPPFTSSNAPAASSKQAAPAPADAAAKDSPADAKWRNRIETSLIKMTAEIAALREQLEARRLFAHSPHYRLFRGIYRWIWAVVSHVAVDMLVLGLVLVWMRRRGDRRLEGVVRGSAGEVASQARRMVGRVRIPGLGRKKDAG